MAPSTEATQRYPKRKRQEIKYYDNEGEDDVVDGQYGEVSDDDGDGAPAPKKFRKETPKKDKPLVKSKIFPLMSLPAELRNKVYGYALTDPNDHYIIAERRANRRVASRVCLNTFRTANAGGRSGWFRRSSHYSSARRDKSRVEDGWDKRVLTPVILRLNKTIYDEALGLLYSHKFSFADTNALHDFLTQIGPRMRPKLRVLEVAEWGYSTAHKAMNYPAMSLLGDAVNLESVWLNICHWERTFNQKIFRDCAAFLLAWGMANGRKDAGIDILRLPSSADEKRPWQAQKSSQSAAANRQVLEGVRYYVNAA